MADDLKDRIRARRAARMASQPAPTEAPQGFAPTPASAAPPAAKDKPGVLGSFIRGAGQGAMFGFQDEIAGAARALTEPLAARFHGVDPSFIPSAGEAYRESRDDYRGVLAEDFEENPWATGGGMLAGGIAVPMGAGLKAATLGGKVLKGAGIGAGFGALQGVGDAPEMGDIPESAIKGAAVGGVVGGAFPAVAAGAGAIRRAAPKVRDAVVAGADKVVDLAEQNPMGRVAVNVASAGMGAPGAPEAAIGVAKGLRQMRPKPKAPPVEPFSMPGAGDEDALAAAIKNAGVEDDLARMKAGMADTPTQQVDPGQILDEATASPVPEVTRQVAPEGWGTPQQVDDEIEQALKILQRPETAPDRAALSEFNRKFSGPGQGGITPREQLPTMPGVGGALPSRNVPKSAATTGSMRAPKAGPKGLEFPEAAPGPETVRPMAGRPDPLDAAQASVGDLPTRQMPREEVRGLLLDPKARGGTPLDDIPELADEIAHNDLYPSLQGVWGDRMDVRGNILPVNRNEPRWMREPDLNRQMRGSMDRDITPPEGSRLPADPSSPKGAAPGGFAVKNEAQRQSRARKAAAKKASAEVFTRPLPSDPWDEFYRADFASVKGLNTPEAYGQALQKAQMSGLPREKAAEYAKAAGWPPEVMQWAGLADEVQANAAPKAAPKPPDALETARQAVGDADELAPKRQIADTPEAMGPMESLAGSARRHVAANAKHGDWFAEYEKAGRILDAGNPNDAIAPLSRALEIAESGGVDQKRLAATKEALEYAKKKGADWTAWEAAKSPQQKADELAENIRQLGRIVGDTEAKIKRDPGGADFYRREADNTRALIAEREAELAQMRAALPKEPEAPRAAPGRSAIRKKPGMLRMAAGEFPVDEGIEQALSEPAAAYRMQHRAPTRGRGVSADDVEGVVPDFYRHPEWYGAGEPGMREGVAALKMMRGNPNAEVTVYRAAPKGATIARGDWVTTSKAYAKQHAAGMEPGTTILAVKVRAKDLFTDGNSVLEFGYDPVRTDLIAKKPKP